MTRITGKLLGGLFALGCGSSAMAGPDHGQWTGQNQWDYPDTQNQTTPDQPPPTPPMQNQGQSPMAHGDWQRPPQPQQPQPLQPSQNSAQDQGSAQDQDEDTVETPAWATKQSHLGIMVISLTQDLRQFFGAPADRGVLIAKVELNSPASRGGVQVGDVLIRVGQQRIGSGDDVIQALEAQGGGRTRLLVVRQSRVVRIDATIPRPQSQGSTNPQQPM